MLATSQARLMAAQTYSDVLWIVLSSGQIVDDLVCREEPKGVGEAHEVLNDTKSAAEVVTVVRCPRLQAVDALSG